MSRRLEPEAAIFGPGASDRRRGGIGERVVHPDAQAKIKGQYVFGPDEHLPAMLWGATVRSPHAAARIRKLDIGVAGALQGVRAVLVSEDLPASKFYGQMMRDQPVLAWETVRYHGEPIAIVAATSRQIARAAARLVHVDYELLTPLTDPVAALAPGARQLHPKGNVLRSLHIERGDPRADAPIVVEGEFETGMQEQFHLATELALAIPTADGGLALRVSTQWLHADKEQIVDCLGIAPEKLKLTLSGVGGAFGAREDITAHIHACLLALRTGRPVKMLYDREESFLAHPKRHPFRIFHRTGVDWEGRLIFSRVKMLVDGGAYASASPAVLESAATFACGPYRIPNVTVDGTAVYTNNPIAGAFRGFGAIQACFGYESQIDRIARRLGMDPVELRLRNVISDGDPMPTTGQIVPSAPLVMLLERCRALPAPPNRTGPTALPGGIGGVTRGHGLRRATAFAIGGKMSGYGSGFPEAATARLTMYPDRVDIKSAAAELGQGLLSVMAQVARSELGVTEIGFEPFDTDVGGAGSSSASRSTRMNGGAVMLASRAIRAKLIERAAAVLECDAESLEMDVQLVRGRDNRTVTVAELLGKGPISEEATYRPTSTVPLHAKTGQGHNAVAFMFAVHRATVEVDPELGLVRVVELSSSQDVGKAINPVGVEGQMAGGALQGLGYVLMERVVTDGGRIRNATLTDYLVPTTLDAPDMILDIVEEPLEGSPYGIKGAGEPPIVSSGAAIMNALRAATGYELLRIPVTPDDLCGLSGNAS